MSYMAIDVPSDSPLSTSNGETKMTHDPFAEATNLPPAPRHLVPTIRCSDDIGKIAEALAAAQAAYPPIEKKHTANAGTYTYKYADIADVLAAVRPVLGLHKLALIQVTNIEQGGQIILYTRLVHGGSGQWFETEYPLGRMEGGLRHQALGASMTYGRRYSVCALVGVAAEEDIDAGEAEIKHEQAPKPAERAQKGKRPPIMVQSEPLPEGTPEGSPPPRKALPPRVGTKEQTHQQRQSAPPRPGADGDKLQTKMSEEEEPSPTGDPEKYFQFVRKTLTSISDPEQYISRARDFLGRIDDSFPPDAAAIRQLIKENALRVGLNVGADDA